VSKSRGPEQSWRPLYRADKKVVLSCFEAALGRRRTASKADREALEAHLPRVNVPGFRPGKAPDDKLAGGLASLGYHHHDVLVQVVPVVLRLWMESREELRTKIEQSLRSDGHEISAVTLSERGFRKDWAPESFHETSDKICAENPTEPSDSVELMICCLTGRVTMGSEHSIQEVQPVNVGINFDEWLNALRDTPEADRVWDAFEPFIKTAEGIYSGKRLSVAAGPAFKDLNANAGVIQEIFGFSDCGSWTPSDFASPVLEEVVADIKALILELEVFRSPLSPSFREQIGELEKRKTAGDHVDSIYVRLSSLRNQNPITPAEPPAVEIGDPLDETPHAVKTEAGGDSRSVEESVSIQTEAPAIPVLAEGAGIQSSALRQDETDRVQPVDFLLADKQVTATDRPETTAAGTQEADATGTQVECAQASVGVIPLESTETFGFTSELDRAAGPDSRLTTMESHLWRLVSEGRNGLAGALADELEKSQPLVRHALPSWLAESVGLSRLVVSETSEAARLLEGAFAHFDDVRLLDSIQAELATALGLLLVSASMRPALIAPRTGASLLLHAAQKLIPSELYELCTAVANFGDRSQALEPAILREVKSEAAWAESIVAIQTKASNWLLKAAHTKISYAPASHVLRKWLERNQAIHSLLQPVRQDDQSKLDVVRASILRLSDTREAKKLVDDTDRTTLGRRLGNPITAGALAQLQTQLEDATAIARDWVALHDQKLGKAKGFKLAVAERIKADVARCSPSAIALLRKYQDRYGASPRGYAAAACAAALIDVQGLFDVDRPFSTSDSSTYLALRGELLFVPGMSLNENWEVEQVDAEVTFNAIRRYLLEPTPDATSTMQRLCQAQDHLATSRLIDYAELHGDDNVSSFSQQRTEALDNARSALQRYAAAALRKIDKAAAFSYVTEAERAEFTAITETIRDHANEDIRICFYKGKIADVLAVIEERRNQEVDAVQKRLLDIAPDHPDRTRIAALLAAGDVITANDYVEMIRNGESLPTEMEEDRDAFREFFPKAIQKIDQLLEEDRKPQSLVARIRAGKTVAGVDMSRVPEGQEQAANAVELWYSLKRDRKIDEHSAKSLLDFLGFNALSAKITRSGRRVWVDVKTDPISDRDRCPLPHFGSEARGSYRVHCIWDHPTEEDLINDVGNSAHGAAAIVFYFGRVSEAKRRELARLSIRGRKTFVLLDETLLIYLCGERGSRLPVFFRCALPFTFNEPYTTTAGLLAPEMLFGRDYERRSIIDPRGSCFIYGGRQLGKTVLLRDVERQVHSLDSNRVAIWLDLKAKGIGYDRPVDDLWVILAGEFKRIGILPASVQVHTSPDRIIEYIRAWLTTNADGRILLLLDEADRFLEIDGGGRGDSTPVGLGEFARAARLKGLMDDTDRRFKVVFAGLHNVQRTTQLENHPLAHFGEPLCIGPLLHGIERREACRLVERPLAALGYRVQSPDLVMRLVAQANYYPSLIQLYCSHLLQHVATRHAAAFQSNTSPPYVLTSKHLDEAYDSRELQAAIRDRLLWTLQLDQRYEVLAYVIAYTFLADRDQGMIKGFPVSQIRQDALGCWPDGFKDRVSEQSFQILLDEMVGLGVLRRSSPGYYTLRSPNVLNLMGSTEEIEAALWRRREPAPQYDAAVFRASHPREQCRRSPLTAIQESHLRTRDHGVVTLFGAQAAGLNDIAEFLAISFGKDAIVNCSDVSDVTGFAERLQDLQERGPEAQTLVFVPPTCHWTDTWLEEAIRKTDKLRSKSSFVRVLFVGDPASAWHWIEGVPMSERMSKLGVALMTLEPWHDAMVRQWLDDCGFRSTPEFRGAIERLTGYWSSLLYQIHAVLKQFGSGSQMPTETLEKLATTSMKSSAALFGLNEVDASSVLQQFAGLNLPADVEDLTTLLDMPRPIVVKTIQWADLLALVRPAGSGTWKIDPAVARIFNGNA
jgi:hypothetical protein